MPVLTDDKSTLPWVCQIRRVQGRVIPSTKAQGLQAVQAETLLEMVQCNAPRNTASQSNQMAHWVKTTQCSSGKGACPPSLTIWVQSTWWNENWLPKVVLRPPHAHCPPWNKFLIQYLLTPGSRNQFLSDLEKWTQLLSPFTQHTFPIATVQSHQPSSICQSQNRQCFQSYTSCICCCPAVRESTHLGLLPPSVVDHCYNAGPTISCLCFLVWVSALEDMWWESLVLFVNQFVFSDTIL